jgi:hypothetical protein
MLTKWYVVAVIAVLILAAVPRLYRLGQVPHGMTWDEASMGYNGHAIRVARRDEWLNRLPLSFRAFGDYKSPLPVYVNGVFTGLFGMNLMAVRLPFAVSGIVAVGFMMALMYTLLRDSLPKTFSLFLSNHAWWLVILSGILMATTPWHVHFSRLGYEAGMALALLIGGVWLFLEFLTFESKTSSTKRSTLYKKVGLGISSALLLAATTYTYQSAKVVVPCLLVTIGILWFKRVKRDWKTMIIFGVAIAISVYPQFADTIWGHGGDRFTQATLFDKGLSMSALLEILTAQFFQHLGPRFLIFGMTTTLRHGDGTWGVLLITSLGLTLVGLAALGMQLVKWFSRQATLAEVRLPLLGVAWLLIGTVPASVGVDSPHSTRALLALPGFVLLAVWGAAWALESIRVSSFNKREMGTHGEKQSVLKIVIGMWILIHSFLFISYQRHYYTIFAAESADEFKDGYLDAFAYIIPYEKGLNGVQPVDQIVFSSEYGQPYIYALFARKTNPIFYQGGSLNKYLFVEKVSISDLERPNTLVVATAQDELPVDRADKVIYDSQGNVKFKIYRTR